MKPTFLRVLYGISRSSSLQVSTKPWLSCKSFSSSVSSIQQQNNVLAKGAGENVSPTDEDFHEALKHEDYFNVRNLVTLKDLFNHNVHLGHHRGCRNDHMKPYLFGCRSDIDIIDLEQTVPLFQDALNFTAHIAYRGGIILFVNRSKAVMPYVERTAEACGEYAHCRHWKPGLFTNMSDMMGHKIRLPDLVIILNTMDGSYREHKVVVDAAKMLIPSVAIVDTNCDPRLITYPVPGNDDTFKTMSYYLDLFETAIKKGKKRRSSEVVQQELLN